MHLESVAFRYRRSAPWVLRGVTLDLPPGGIVEVTGRNGAGKSTLLRVLAGLLCPGRGTVSGRPKIVGYAPERFPVAQPFTARAYLTHMARMRRADPTRITHWAVRLGFDTLLDVPLPELSKGTAHKVGLTQALLADPGLLVLDEPFAGLDPPTRALLPDLLTEMAAQGTTIIVTDHQQALRTTPSVHHLEMTAGTITPPRAIPEQTRPADPGEVVIEVIVPADDAAAALKELRANGYDARRQRS